MAGVTDFKIVFNNENPKSYIHITPSLSPIFGNNPGYQVVYYNATNANFTNYLSCYVDLADSIPEWQEEYNFNKSYGQVEFTPEGMFEHYQKLSSDSVLLQNYFNFYPSSSKASSFINYDNWYAYKCGMVNILEQNYSDCATH